MKGEDAVVSAGMPLHVYRFVPQQSKSKHSALCVQFTSTIASSQYVLRFHVCNRTIECSSGVLESALHTASGRNEEKSEARNGRA